MSGYAGPERRRSADRRTNNDLQAINAALVETNAVLQRAIVRSREVLHPGTGRARMHAALIAAGLVDDGDFAVTG